ncbi:hypothetical protein KCTC32516_01525 [Polaribacter huanghezhanensis]|uniref:hypothetical protein n=1 Tax=Polaribacter huanghezhanensis TaxID=1354726 RepID=UPI00264760C5|nr:hypothetical protein [Polaribacter huanghezhanensis]WKD86166.1 hypothetical protein KCTC32516_01525 [Polaribacter huanghezhanensis]
MEKEKIVIEYETKQRVLKKRVKKIKRKTPYSIFIFFAIALVFLLDGKLDKFLGNSYNLIPIISAFFVLTTAIYIVMITLKIKDINKEVKSLGEKMYKKMKL